MFLSLIGALYGLDTNRFDCIRLDDDNPPHELTGKKMYFARIPIRIRIKVFMGNVWNSPCNWRVHFLWNMKSVKAVPSVFHNGFVPVYKFSYNTTWKLQLPSWTLPQPLPYWQVGLAVGDIQGLQENASLQKLRIQVILNLRAFVIKLWILHNACTVYVVYLMKITGQYFAFPVDIL